MQIKFVLISTLVLVLSPVVMAMPQKYSDCHFQVSTPKGAGSYFFDEDCKTIYVTPPLIGRTVFKVASEIPDLNATCNQIEANEREALSLANAGLEDSTRLLKAQKAGVEISKMLEEMDASRAERNHRDRELFEESGRIGGREASVVEVRFYSDWEGAVSSYQEANPDLKVMALPLEAMAININEQEEKDLDPQAHEAVLSLKLESAEGMPSWRSTKFHEGIKAKMRLSHFGMCGHGQADFRAYVAGTLTYAFRLSGEIFYGTEAL